MEEHLQHVGAEWALTCADQGALPREVGCDLWEPWEKSQGPPRSSESFDGCVELGSLLRAPSPLSSAQLKD